MSDRPYLEEMAERTAADVMSKPTPLYTGIGSITLPVPPFRPDFRPRAPDADAIPIAELSRRVAAGAKAEPSLFDDLEAEEAAKRRARFTRSLDDDTVPIALAYAETEHLFAELIRRSGDTDGSSTELREGMRETPARAAKAWKFWCGGYAIDVDSLFKTFEDGAAGYDEMVVVANIPVHSHCEHHLAPITGVAHVGYIPNGRVVGLSKIARVVDALSRRFQVQERLTTEIADAIDRNLSPLGVAVFVEATHGCMTTRGVHIHGGRTGTSALRGAIKNEPSARAEFYAVVDRLAKGASA